MSTQASLAKGQQVILKVSVTYLEPSISRGDAVTLRKVPLSDIAVDDIVYCPVGGRGGLHRIVNERVLNGKRVLEVKDSRGMHHAVDEAGAWGKVVDTHRAGQLNEKKSAVGHLFDRLKNLFQ